MWAQAKDPIGDWCRPEDGLFALEEAPRACPNVQPSNVGMAGPTSRYFFPDLALSLLHAIPRGAEGKRRCCAAMGRWADPVNPMAYGYQEVITGLLYAGFRDCTGKSPATKTL